MYKGQNPSNLHRFSKRCPHNMRRRSTRLIENLNSDANHGRLRYNLFVAKSDVHVVITAISAAVLF